MNAITSDGSGVLILLGIAVSGGILNALIVKRVSIPQVLGYMISGIILGSSGFKLITPNDIEKLSPVNLFCLAVIGFMVGGEIKFDTMKKYGKQFTAILLGEGLTTFFIVLIAITTILYVVTGNLAMSVAGGMVFGAIASATDPASTIAVLWEYRSAGILTTTVTAIVALDDALAMTLYGLGSGVAELLGHGHANIPKEMFHISIELFGSIAMGIAAGLILSSILKRASKPDTATVSSVGLLMFITGIADHYNMDIILAAMSAGITVANRYPYLYERLSSRIKAFSTTIYVLFFVLVGARLKLQSMPWWLWTMVGSYVVGRSMGKLSGAWIGARISKAGPIVERYSGMGILAQGGVAVGLSIMAAQKLGGMQVSGDMALGDVIIFGITTTTFIVQLIGPLMTKMAIIWAKEIGRNVTEEDVAAQLTLADIPAVTQSAVAPSTSVHDVFSQFSKNNLDLLAVVDTEQHLTGCIGIGELRKLMLEGETWHWLIAEDVTADPKVVLQSDQPVKEALRIMDQIDASGIPVTTPEGTFKGIISRAAIKDGIRKKMVESHLLKVE
ncbi:MAG: cation:proton antiporter [Chitinispirillaceae bacterium]|nr:cation:proton antiporter [Chitinispirillaceae bacterium]